MNSKKSTMSRNAFVFLTAFVFSFLITSCFNDLQTSRGTKVSFYMDRATVEKIINKALDNSASARAGGDEAEFYVDVELIGNDVQKKTVPVTSEIQVEFEDVPVGSTVYAKAKFYKYLDDKGTRDVIYNGTSSKIVVHENVNALTIKLTSAVLTVAFNSNGGSSVSSQAVARGNSANEPQKPKKPLSKQKNERGNNYAFYAWYKDAQLSQGYDFSSPVIDDLTLYAKWLPGFVLVEGELVTDYLADGRDITIRDIFVCDHEVTQREYYAITNKTPSSNNKINSPEEFPVENISWFDAIAYCNLLSIQEELTPCYKINDKTDPAEWGTPAATTSVSCNVSANGYRLPTEAEWEFIATKGQRSDETFDKFVLSSSNSANSTQSEDNRFPDQLWLTNVLGNVAEWCNDYYSDSIDSTVSATGPASGSQRVVRGGAYNSPASECAPDSRSSSDPLSKSPAIGFRVVRTAINEFSVIRNKVTFNTNGGSAVAEQNVISGETISAPTNPTKTGYNFDGWLYNGSAFDFTSPITQDIVLQAQWDPITYTITYGNDSEWTWASESGPASYTIEDSVTLRPPARAGYSFEGWFDSQDDNNNGTGNEVLSWSAGNKIGNITLYPKWSAGNSTYIVEHYFQKLNADGSGSTDYNNETSYTNTGIVGTTGQTTNAASYQQTVAGFEFERVENVTIAADNSSVAKIYYKRSTITYTFEKNSNETWRDGTASSTITKTGLYGAEFTAPEIEKLGYSFNNWKSGGTALTGNTFGAENKTFTAYWTAVNYPITIHLNGGKLSGSTEDYEDELNIADNNSLVLTDFIPTRNNFTFAGYYTDENFTQAAPDVIDLVNNTNHLHDWNLYAKWTYTVTFNTNGGNTIAPIADVLYTQAASAPADPTKEGYDFGGWYTNSNLQSSYAYTFGSASTTGNLTLYAKWNLATYTITYHCEGGHTNPTTYTIETETFTLSDPSGFDEDLIYNADNTYFTGWYTDEYYGTKILEIPNGSTGDMDLYARQSNTIYVSYVSEPAGNSANDGLIPSKPVDSVDTAISKIVTYSKAIPWRIVIRGSKTGDNAGPIVINSTTINSSVASSLSISGYDVDTVIDGGSLTTGDNRTTLTISTTVPVQLSRLIITGGRGTVSDSKYYGGGLYLGAGADVVLTNDVKIYGNKCDFGGGVYVGQNATLCIAGNCVVGDTSKTDAISNIRTTTTAYAQSDLSAIVNSVSNTDYADWKCANYAAGDGSTPGGGGIYNCGTVAIGFMKYQGQNNTGTVYSTMSGGGIYCNCSNKGGGIYNAKDFESHIAMDSGNISYNVATAQSGYGGGIFNQGTAGTDGSVCLTGGTISDNHAYSAGGGIWIVGTNSNVLLKGNAQITDNHVYDGDGAGVYVRGGAFTMTAGTISGNQTHKNASEAYPGIYVLQSSLTITGGTIKQNKNKDGMNICGVYYSPANGTSFTLGGSATIAYSSEDRNTIAVTGPITVSTTGMSFTIKWESSLSEDTTILQGGTSTDYQYFTLYPEDAGDGAIWVLDTDTGKAKKQN